MCLQSLEKGWAKGGLDQGAEVGCCSDGNEADLLRNPSLTGEGHDGLFSFDELAEWVPVMEGQSRGGRRQMDFLGIRFLV